MPLENLCALAPGALTKVGNTVFRKQLLRYGRWIHPADSTQFFEVDAKLIDTLVENFNLATYDTFIPVMMAKDQKDPHNVIPTDSVGRVVGLQSDTDGLYSLMEFGEPEILDKATKNLIPGVSAGISLNYLHKEKGVDVGPVLKHVVLCNEPYIKNLRGFEQVQLSEAGKPDTFWKVIEFAEVNRAMTREQLEILAKKMNIDPAKFAKDDALLAEVSRVQDLNVVALAEVPALKTKATQHDTLLAENTTLKAKVTELETAKPDPAKVVELSEKVNKVTTDNVNLTTKIAELELANKRTAATAQVDVLIRDGKVVPANKDTMIELAVSSPDTFKKLTENAPVIVDLAERGQAPTGDRLPGGTMTPDKAAAEVTRLTGLYLTKKSA